MNGTPSPPDVGWDGQVNFVAYDEVEELQRYRDAQALAAYRTERLNAHTDHVAFVRAHASDRVVRVVDVGSGSSALLYALHLAGVLGEGVGVELSRSRHVFAEQWKRDLGCTTVTNVCGDVTAARLAPGRTDLFLVVDNTFSYLAPEHPDYPARVVRAARETLVRDGLLVIEINNSLPTIAAMTDDTITFWKELSASNAFRYALYRRSIHRQRNLLRTEGRYIARDGTEKQKVELSTVYTYDALVVLLVAHGFRPRAAYGSFRQEPFDAASSDRLVVVAARV